ncbi:MAG: hypothetical protein FJ224_06910 [Lentisphaerae bacterium]|nr:hypothetical protein [Lentisphaerota bacterium]
MIVLQFIVLYVLAGALSVLAWVSAATLLAKGLRRRPRWGLLFAALTLALLAYVTAELSSLTLSTKARLDTRAEERAAREEQAAVAAASANMTENEDGETELTAQFAESLPHPAGDKPPTLDGAISTNETTSLAQVPAYRQSGKREREKGKKQRIDIDVKEVAPETDEFVYIKSGLMTALKIADRLNRFTLRLVLWACIGFVLWDYLKAFNSALATRWLVPIGGPWLDSFSPRARMLLVTPRAAAGRLPPEYYAGSVLRKGEQLIYFGAQDPWPDQPVLERFRLGSWRIAGVKKLVAGTPGIPLETEFLLDGAWFRHYAVVVPDAGMADAILAEVARLLGQRQETRARARRAVHIVWSLPTRPAADVAAQLRWIADRVNVTLAVWTKDDNLLPKDNEAFDVIYSEPLKPELRIRDELRARSQSCGGGADSGEHARIRAQLLAEKTARHAERQKAREAARLEEQAKAERGAREAAQKAAAEKVAQAEAERKARAAVEKAAAEKAAQAEAERVAREAARLEEQAKAERMTREAAQKAVEEQAAQAEAERVAREAAQKAAEEQAASGGSFKFACPSCGQKLEAESEWVGMEFQCPSCETKLTVPPR